MRQQNEDWLFPLRDHIPLQPLPYEYIEGRDCRDAFNYSDFQVNRPQRRGFALLNPYMKM